MMASAAALPSVTNAARAKMMSDPPTAFRGRNSCGSIVAMLFLYILVATSLTSHIIFYIGNYYLMSTTARDKLASHIFAYSSK